MSDATVQRREPPYGPAATLTTSELVDELLFRMSQYASYSTPGARTRIAAGGVASVLAGVADDGLEDEILMNDRRLRPVPSTNDGVTEDHWLDSEGRPAGGYAWAPGLALVWQRGALVDADGARLPRNGAFVEEVIAVGAGRLRHYQETQFACVENAVALGHLLAAGVVLDQRQRARRAAGVAGSHQLHES